MSAMEIYFLGVMVAFVVNLFEFRISLSQLASKKSKNLAAIGLHYSCFMGKCTAESPSGFKFGVYVVWMLLITTMFSWLTVGVSIYSLGTFSMQQLSIPNEVKLIQHRLSSVQLSKKQVFGLINELYKIYYLELMDKSVEERIYSGDPVILNELSNKIVI